MVDAAAESGAPLPSTDTWRRVFAAPIDVRATAAGSETVLEARLAVEGEFLFPHLISHLRAEFPKFAGSTRGRLSWHDSSVRVWSRHAMSRSSCSTVAGLPYMRAGTQEWLSFQFPAYLCQVVMRESRTRDRARACHGGAVRRLVAAQTQGLPRHNPCRGDGHRRRPLPRGI